MSWKAVGKVFANIGKGAMSAALWASDHPEVVTIVASVAGQPAVGAVVNKTLDETVDRVRPKEKGNAEGATRQAGTQGEAEGADGEAG